MWNCLLMNKMSDVQKSNRGRTKTLADSTRKRHKKEDFPKYRKTRVSIDDEYDRWTELKDVLRIKTHAEIIHSSYHTLLGKLRNCSWFIINVLMAIPVPEMDGRPVAKYLILATKSCSKLGSHWPNKKRFDELPKRPFKIVVLSKSDINCNCNGR